MSNELARRAVACRHWRWMPGMRLQNGYMLKDEDFPTHGDEHGWLPDLSNPATLGCLLALVREAWGDSGAFCECSQVLGEPMWNVYLSSLQYRKQHKWKGTGVGDGDTEAKALVAALEAAP